MRRRETILDELLVLESQKGDRVAFERLVERWHPRLLRLARRLTQSDDAGEPVQEAWLAVVRGLGRLDDPARFGTWAYRIVAFKCADWIRRRQRSRRLERRIEAEPRTPNPAVGASEAARREDAIGALGAALATLPASKRAILEMHYLDELPVAAIGEILRIPSGTVKSRLYHARRELRETLEEPK